MNKYYYSDGAVLGYKSYNRILHRLDGPAVETNNGNKYWYKNGVLHRVGGPAIDNPEIEEWYQNGILHRLDGPALLWVGIKEEWWQNGKLHRLEGPAVKHVGGMSLWFINGKRVDGKQLEKHILTMKLSGLSDE